MSIILRTSHGILKVASSIFSNSNMRSLFDGIFGTSIVTWLVIFNEFLFQKNLYLMSTDLQTLVSNHASWAQTKGSEMCRTDEVLPKFTNSLLSA